VRCQKGGSSFSVEGENAKHCPPQISCEKRMRRKSRVIKIGNIKIGGNNPVVVQGMTKTLTEDIPSTIKQIHQLQKAGAGIVRLAVPNIRAAKSISTIKKEAEVPLVADIHFNLELALEAIKQGIDKIRINPGNMSEEKIIQITQKAQEKGIPIRIGINSGSLKGVSSSEKKNKERKEEHQRIVARRMVESALKTINLLEKENFREIVISLKSSDVLTTILSAQLISKETIYPLHLGVTATGPLFPGLIKSAIGIGSLLTQGIGDTLRVSLSDSPVEEVKAGYEILKSLNLSQHGPIIISCPGCGRCKVDLKLVINNLLPKLKRIKFPLKIAIMGCEVNGPGEAKEADVGVAYIKGAGVIFRKGEIIARVKEDKIPEALLKEAEKLIPK